MEPSNSIWQRIPLPIESDADRRALSGILISAGLEVRVVRIKLTPRGAPKRFVEYRLQQKEQSFQN